MSKNIMDARDYLSLMEDIGNDTKNPIAPSPSDTLVTNIGKSSKSTSPLSTLGGCKDGKPHEEKNKHKGGEGKSLANMAGTGGKDVKVTQEKPNSDAPKDAKVASMGKDKKTTAVDESWTFEDADIESMDDDENMDSGVDMESDMDYDGIKMTKEFLNNLLNGVSRASLDSPDIDKICDAIEGCCEEVDTLDVADIPKIMSALKGDEDMDMDDSDMDDEDMDMEECWDKDKKMNESKRTNRKRSRLTENKVVDALMGMLMKLHGPRF